MAGEGSNQAKRAPRHPVGNFEKVVVGRCGIGPSIQPAPYLLELPLIAVAVEALRGKSGGYRVRIREDGR